MGGRPAWLHFEEWGGGAPCRKEACSVPNWVVQGMPRADWPIMWGGVHRMRGGVRARR